MKKITCQDHNRTVGFKTLLIFGLSVGTPFSAGWGASQDLPGLSIARLALPSVVHENGLPQPTGTSIGEKAIDIKKNIINLSHAAGTNIQEVRNLYGNAITEVDSYHRLVGEIEAKLQLGTTPANPNLIKLRERANAELSQISAVIESMEDYVNNFKVTLQEANILGGEIKETLLMPGALDEDHAHLLKMDEELDSFKATIHQSLNILMGNAQRQKEWLIAERDHFALLCSAIEKGKSQISPQRGPNYPQLVDLPDIPPSPQTKTLVVGALKQEAALSQSPSSDKPISLSPVEIKEEVPVEFVPANPDVHSVPEDTKSVEVAQKEEILTLSQALQGRQPIAVVSANQVARLQKWYLFTTVQRELKSHHDKIEILNLTKSQGTHNRGDDVMSLLIEMGIPSDQIIVTNVTGDDEQPDQLVIVKAP